MSKQVRNTENPLDRARDAATLALVFRKVGGFKVGQHLIRLVWMGPKSHMEKDLLRMLEDGRLPKSLKMLFGIDYSEFTQFEVTVTKNKNGFHLATLYLTKSRSAIEQQLRDLATLPIE